MWNSALCNVEFSNGQAKEHSANVIADKIFARVDSDEFIITLLEAI